MAKPVKKAPSFSGEDTVCVECIKDFALKELVKSEGAKSSCSVCGNKNVNVSISNLATILDPYIREHFVHGHMERKYGTGDDDSYWEEQQGEDLSFVLQELTGQYFEFQDALISALQDSEPYDHDSGEGAFYDSSVNYEEVPVYLGDLYAEWREISDELKHHRRFFSDRAKKFFDWLFEELETLWFYGSGVDFSDLPKKISQHKLYVVHELPMESKILRARKADVEEQFNQILLNPESELAPPPPQMARAGRMNSEGISIFYGALDRNTCLAEMRSSIGGHLVLGEFVTVKSLRILDFRRLDRAYGGNDLSYFQPDFKEQISRRKFLREIHRLISEPVVSGREHEYLITQVLAEYLGHVRANNFDGLLFRSTQENDGVNVVLFAKQYAEKVTLERFSVAFIQDSATLHKTTGIKYDFDELRYSTIKNKIYVHYDDYDT